MRKGNLTLDKGTKRNRRRSKIISIEVIENGTLIINVKKYI